jgi:hypothetical protein
LQYRVQIGTQWITSEKQIAIGSITGQYTNPCDYGFEYADKCQNEIKWTANCELPRDVTSFWRVTLPTGFSYTQIGQEVISPLFLRNYPYQRVTVEHFLQGRCDTAPVLFWQTWYNTTYFNGCSGFEDPVPFKSAVAVEVYPNPSTDFLDVKITPPNNSYEVVQTYHISLSTAQGVQVGQYETQNLEYRIPTANYPQGLYLLSVSSQYGSTTQKIVIQK